MRYLIILILMNFYALSSIFAADEDISLKESELIDFSSIKDVLKQDMLEKEAKKKKTIIVKKKKQLNSVNKAKDNIPDKAEFWSFFSEYWAVKNATVLKWDFQKPDYGLEASFASFLERMGHYEQSFKILLVNSPNVTHFALPSNPNEYIFILSVPFVRTLDLSKLEISLLLYEDFIRVKMGYFVENIKNSGFDELIGKNLEGKKLKTEVIEKILKGYDEIIFDKGFTFQQQYEVTKQVGGLLKSNLSLWNTYLGLIGKIDDLTKSNILYKYHSQIYPSPEMQIKWLNPSKG